MSQQVVEAKVKKIVEGEVASTQVRTGAADHIFAPMGLVVTADQCVRR